MMATEPRVLTLTFRIDPNGDIAAQIVNHVAVARYLEAGYAIQAHGTVVKGGAATVPLIVPEDEGRGTGVAP